MVLRVFFFLHIKIRFQSFLFQEFQNFRMAIMGLIFLTDAHFDVPENAFGSKS